ncbi:MAG: type II secretion system major pseudopilin GspG [Gammaproteobacteria bacterium]|nr:type II secretion system major pseudopilin GspG [Gammaproteobacteria bacterium]
MRIRQQSSGFTLIEVMVVVVILGILASIIVPKIMNKPEEARVVKAKQDIRAIQSALEMYKLDNFVYPTTDQGLQALVTKPTTDPVPPHWKQYLDRLPIDPWDHPYQYLNPGVHGPIDIWSYGPKGPSGGSSDAGAIGNWNLEGSSTGTGSGTSGH